MNLITIAQMTWISLRKKIKSSLPMLYTGTANIPIMVQITHKKQLDSECNGGKEGFQHPKYC